MNHVILRIVGVGGDGSIQESDSGSSCQSHEDAKELKVALRDFILIDCSEKQRI